MPPFERSASSTQSDIAALIRAAIHGNPLQTAGRIAGGSLGPLGSLAGGLLGGELAHLLGLGGGGAGSGGAGVSPANLARGQTPAQPVYVTIPGVSELLSELVSLTRAAQLRSAGIGIDRLTANLAVQNRRAGLPE